MNGHLESNAGYFDPHAEAQSLGERLGRLRGKQEGVREGHAVGYNLGWDEATTRANEELRKQLEFTRQHIAQKEALATQLAEQRTLIDQLQTRLDEMERENGTLKTENRHFQDVVSALRDANQHLQLEVGQLDIRYKQRTQEYTEQLWQYNHNMVFMNSVRSVLEDLTRGGGAPARHVRQLFAQRYREQVNSARSRGTILVAPDQDEAFARLLPKTQKFIADLLATMSHPGSQNTRERVVNPIPEEAEDHRPGL